MVLPAVHPRTFPDLLIWVLEPATVQETHNSFAFISFVTILGTKGNCFLPELSCSCVDMRDSPLWLEGVWSQAP